MKPDQSIVEILDYKVFSGGKDFFRNGFAGVINTLNPHSYVVARGDSSFSDALKASDILVADGVGITLAVKVLAGKKIEKISGSDLHEVLLDQLGKKSGSCFYLGSSEDTLRKIRKRISGKYPEIKVGVLSPPFQEIFSYEVNNLMVKAINQFHPDILFVGMTAPKQEKWIYDNKHLLNANVICAIGAVFDFYAGTKKRSGKFWISIGLEWLPRLFREPLRLWRRNFISSPLFVWYVLREKFRLIITQNKP